MRTTLRLVGRAGRSSLRWRGEAWASDVGRGQGEPCRPQAPPGPSRPGRRPIPASAHSLGSKQRWEGPCSGQRNPTVQRLLPRGPGRGGRKHSFGREGGLSGKQAAREAPSSSPWTSPRAGHRGGAAGMPPGGDGQPNRAPSSPGCALWSLFGEGPGQRGSSVPGDGPGLGRRPLGGWRGIPCASSDRPNHQRPWKVPDEHTQRRPPGAGCGSSFL